MASVPDRIGQLLHCLIVVSMLLGCDATSDRHSSSTDATVEIPADQPTSKTPLATTEKSPPSVASTKPIEPATHPKPSELTAPVPAKLQGLAADIQTVAMLFTKLGGEVEVGVGEKVIDIDLDGRDVSDEQLSQLATLSDLKSLNLSNTAITDVGLKQLTSLKKLKFLYLFGTRVTDAGMASIVTLPRLEVLCLDSTEITDLGLKTLEDLPRLEKLHVHSRAKVTDVGLESLQKHTRLFELRIGGPHVSEKAIDALKAALPNCTIVYDPGTEAKPE